MIEERATRTLNSSTQATIEIDALLDGTDILQAFSKAWFKELNMDYFRSSKRPVERCLWDGGIDKRSVHDVVHVRGFARISIVLKMMQEFPNGKEPNRRINPFLVAILEQSFLFFFDESRCSSALFLGHVVCPGLSSSSDEHHHLLHSCLGTGMRFGTQNKFCR